MHQAPVPEEEAKIPMSMVLALGKSIKNRSLSQLVKDFRFVMLPHTAISMRERKGNKLKDFVVMTGPLGVSDLFVFKQSEGSGNISMRIGKMPRGPSLQFRVNTYSLIKDVRRIMKRPKSVGRDSMAFNTPPLLVMNGFSKVGEMENHEKFLVTVFQNLFSSIQPHATKVNTIRRVLLINRNPDGNIDIRHYAIDTKLVEHNRNIKKLVEMNHNPHKKLPNLGTHADISDLVLDLYSVGGLTSDSEVEDDAVVDIRNDQVKHIRRKVAADLSYTRKRAVKLQELGPRLNMTLIKIEESMLGESKTIYHSKYHKLKAEEKELEAKHQARLEEKAKRRAAQQANIDAKQKKNGEKKARKLARKEGPLPDGDGDDEESEDEVEINPSDYENDSDLFSDQD